jgi:hypothetical protein
LSRSALGVRTNGGRTTPKTAHKTNSVRTEGLPHLCRRNGKLAIASFVISGLEPMAALRSESVVQFLVYGQLEVSHIFPAIARKDCRSSSGIKGPSAL